MQFGRSSERLTRHIEQLELRLEELEAGEAEEIAKAAAEDRPLPIRDGDRPKRKPLPDHLNFVFWTPLGRSARRRTRRQCEAHRGWRR